MREIKFRAKINKAGEVEGLSDWQYFDIFDLMNYPGLKELVDWDTLGQFNGLKDQNGKEIYEGDIVRGERVDYFRDGVQEQTVEWRDGAFYPFADNNDYAPYPNPKEVEVIGDIYEKGDEE